MIRNSSDISVTNSEFHHSWHGITMMDNNGVRIEGNYFHDIRTDGVRGASTSNLVVSNNFFTNFKPEPGDHPDALQLWTTNTTASARDITITGNLIHRGAGDAMQGIFLRDQVGNLPFVNVAIADNIVIGAMFNGIALGNSVTSSATDNVVVGLLDQRSWILAGNPRDVAMSGNSSSTYLIDGANVRPAGNIVTGPTVEAGRGALASWLAVRGSDAGGLPDAVQAFVATLPPVVVTQAPVPIPEAVGPLMVTTNGTTGADTLSVAKSGNGILRAGSGNDSLNGSASGINFLYGESGDDTYRVQGAGDRVVEAAGGGNDAVFAFVDYTLTDNVEVLRMGKAGLVGTGNALDNRMVGSAGADEMHGGLGNDRIEGGARADTLTGGLGADIFIVRDTDRSGILATNKDTITDFSRSQGDKISLSLFDANVNTTRDDAFTFVGTRAFSGTAGELRFQVANGSAFVTGDTNGDGVADFTIVLAGVTNVTSTDFVL